VIHAAYITAYAAALHPVFFTAAAVMLGAFGLSWLLRDVPLRKPRASRAIGPIAVFKAPRVAGCIATGLRN
jgi:hypothetical protein